MLMSRTTEHRLIRRARRGDREAIEGLIQAHQDSLYAFMLRMSGRPEVAEDIVQEAFVRVLKNLDRFDTRFRFSTWLFTIAKRLYVNAIQKHAPAFDTDAVGAQAGTGNPPEHRTGRHETIDNLRSVLEIALDSLGEQPREIVRLFHQLEWSITEIAEHMEMPEGTVKSHLHRARRRMRTLIDADERLSRMAEEARA